MIYRKKDIIKDWEYDKYNTFCDRVFLTNQLSKNNSFAAYIKEPSIFVRDHSLDERDSRAETQNEENVIELSSFYKNILIKKYPKKYALKKCTNLLLLGYNNLIKRNGLLNFYKKTKKMDLIDIWQIDSVGVYSILTLPFSNKTKSIILKLIRKAYHENK